jgi:serine/threonine protein kinase
MPPDTPWPFDEREAWRLVAGAAKGLRAMHAAGLAHRDVKVCSFLVFFVLLIYSFLCSSILFFARYSFAST